MLGQSHIFVQNMGSLVFDFSSNLAIHFQLKMYTAFSHNHRKMLGIALEHIFDNELKKSLGLKYS